MTDDTRRERTLAPVFQDFLYAIRTLAKSRGFTAVAVVTLALGISASTALFSVIHNVLVAPFPYADSQRLMSIQIHDTGRSEPGGRGGFVGPEFLDYTEQNHVFDGVVGSANQDVLYTSGEGTERFEGLLVTPGTFEFFGMPALLGRTLPPYGGIRSEVEVAGKTDPEKWNAVVQLCSEGYFAVVRIAFLEGRTFNEAEVSGARKVAVVNQTFAKKYLGKTSPIGQRIRLAELANFPDKVEDPSFEVIGVVKDAKNQGLEEPPLPEAWVPYTLTGSGERGVLVRTVNDPLLMLNAVRREIWATDRNVALTFTGSMEGFISQFSYAGPRFAFLMMTIFATIGLVLVTIGVYSVISYTASRQTHEIGIRMALGARRTDVLKLVIRMGARLVVLGLAIGLLVSLALSRVIASQLWGVSPYDPVTLASVAAVLLLTGLVACWVPARRATLVDPLVALRYE